MKNWDPLLAMAGAVAWERRAPVLPDPAAALVTIELRDQSGRMLPGLIVGDRWFVVGEEGRRYFIVVRTVATFVLRLCCRSTDSMSSMVDPLRLANAVTFLIHIKSWWWKDLGKARKRWRPFASDRSANLTPPRNITTLATSGSSALPCSTKGSDPGTNEEVRRRLKANPFPGRFATPP
jgi:hypothetical protein